MLQFHAKREPNAALADAMIVTGPLALPIYMYAAAVKLTINGETSYISREDAATIAASLQAQLRDG